ncbi:tRNA-Thr(GGU) m(6)t(6)A37 methyltransferase TsaA [Humidesulfovibrio mexicanus]|uniref:tRNA-Thr(GGU) m(6)t(6)A37 methyltransferase TsaA n=1 Tax=Humidesulfovibrio mexicanus TaxID=147047 RepID=A0A239A6C3_9BACT|nr:tRNA (N6-threonylcarbamoyladenosine(37)-N6)-methyltransferase TrmO [Humidesulfovibrio mexicanus]SNR90443.1 tRNA-Thr(GGU) m(6)t(6)A37 methyltransferase TsaA [Humidesulfovibrio mexicanus]
MPDKSPRSLLQAVSCVPIGVLRSPHVDLAGMPIQPVGARGVAGHIELELQYAPGLKDLDGFSHVIVLYHLHGSTGFDLVVTPFLDDEQRGVFATRAPRRPNPIGLSVLELTCVDVERGVVELMNVDILDGTPVLDIKPYVPAFDVWQPARTGWIGRNGTDASVCRSDERFR